MKMQQFKRITVNLALGLIAVSALVSISYSSISAQDKPTRVYMYLDYFHIDDRQFLQTEMKYREEGTFYQIGSEEVRFFQETEDDKILLGKAMTGEDGIARFDLQNESVSWDSTGMARFQAEFNGNDKYKRARKGVEIKKISLSLSAEEVDSVFQLTVKGFEQAGDEQVPIDGEDLRVFVKRLYDDMPIQEGSFDEGMFSFEFPQNIPGDAFGDLVVIARIQEHDDYGTVETRQTVRWGKPVPYLVEEKPRALWARAPLWIMVGLWGALIVAWFYYFLSISNLFGMKNA